MRISEEMREFFKKSTQSILPDSKVYLFGSRTDDNKKGGDIDILVIGNRKLNFSEKTKIKYGFYKKFGEQKVDLLSYSSNSDDTFLSLIKDDAIEL